MKIALVTSAFYESTLPLYKHISEHCEVDLYCIFYGKFKNPPAFDLSAVAYSRSEGLKEISQEYVPAEVVRYLGTRLRNVHVYMYEFSIKHLFCSRNLISNKIGKLDYDIVHFIGMTSLYPSIANTVKGKSKIIFSLHETDAFRAESGKRGLKNMVKRIVNKRINNVLNKANFFTFFSKNENDKFAGIFGEKARSSRVIKFGNFETFPYFEDKGLLDLNPRDYILYLGSIRPYKGVDFLIDAYGSSSLQDKYKLVIAGKDDMELSRKTYKNIQFVNKFLTDNEMVELIKNCKVVVLPYFNASQSGLPSLVLQYRKPIVFSNVKGLDEYLIDGYNGMQFVCKDQVSLLETLERMLNVETYQAIVNNISRNEFNEDLSWPTISQSYLTLYKEILDEEE